MVKPGPSSRPDDQNASSESGFNGTLGDAKARYYQALEDFQRVNTSGSADQRTEAAKRVHDAQVNFSRAKGTAGGY